MQRAELLEREKEIIFYTVSRRVDGAIKLLGEQRGDRTLDYPGLACLVHYIRGHNDRGVTKGLIVSNTAVCPRF